MNLFSHTEFNFANQCTFLNPLFLETSGSGYDISLVVLGFHGRVWRPVLVVDLSHCWKKKMMDQTLNRETAEMQATEYSVAANWIQSERWDEDRLPRPSHDKKKKRRQQITLLKKDIVHKSSSWSRGWKRVQAGNLAQLTRLRAETVTVLKNSGQRTERKKRGRSGKTLQKIFMKWGCMSKREPS